MDKNKRYQLLTLFAQIVGVAIFIGILGFVVLQTRGMFAQDAAVVTGASSSVIESSAASVSSVAVVAPSQGHGAVATGHGGGAPKARNLAEENMPDFSVTEFLINVMKTTGIYAFISEKNVAITPAGDSTVVYGWQKLIMILVGLVLIWLGAAKNFEPLLLIPIGFGTVLVNVPIANMGELGGFLRIIFDAGVGNELFPLIIFMGIGALTDFGPLIANPKTALLGAAAQFGVFGTILGAILMNLIPGISYTLKEACAISIIGGADGPTSIYIAASLAPHLLGPIAVAAYSYMALVPLIQPPIMRALTTEKERKIKMKQLRHVSKIEKILFPMLVLVLCVILIPAAAPLLGSFAFGNFVREIGIVERLSKTLQNELLNIVTIFLSLGVGSQMSPDKFMQPATLGIVFLGLVAFSLATAAGVLLAKLMNKLSKDPINPLIGSAGVSAVPMASRVSNKVGLESDPSNFLLMHAMGPNVAGVIGTAIAAGVLIALFK